MVLAVLALVLHRCSTTRAEEGLIDYGWGFENPPPCDPMPRLDVRELATWSGECDLGGALIDYGPYTVRVPGFPGDCAEFLDAGSLGVMNIGGDYGPVVYTSERLWGRPKAVELAKDPGAGTNLLPWRGDSEEPGPGDTAEPVCEPDADDL